MAINYFEKITKNLQKEGIELSEFSNFLHYSLQTKIINSDKSLKQQFVNLQKFKDFLEENSLSNKDIYQDLTSLPKEVSLLKQLALKLLLEETITLADLNLLLKTIPIKQLNPKTFLVALLQKKIILVEEFLELVQGNWTEIQENNAPYSVKSNGNYLEFYFSLKQKNETIGPYQLVEEIGRGGVGIVYKVYHETENQYYALKILKEDQCHEQNLKRFVREIQTMVVLEHPGLVQIVDTGKEKGQLYLVMEFVDGQVLSEVLSNKDLSLRDWILHCRDALNTLQYAHEQGIVHRDLKLDNIFLTKGNQVKIGDFGLAKELKLSSQSQKLTQSGAVLGTIHYMPPEQLKGEIQHIDTTADLYSLGVCLYRLLTKQYPFNSAVLTKLVDDILNQEPQIPSQLNPNIHPDLDTILLKALEKSSSERYQSAAEFSSDLDRFLNGYPLAAKSVSFPKKCNKWRKRNRQSLIFLFLSMLCFFVFWLTLQWSYFQKTQLSFNNAINRAIREQRRAEKFMETGFQQKGKKIEHYLNALYFLNEALSLKKGNLSAEQQKWDITLKLIFLSCEMQEFSLATYLAYDLERLTRVSEQVKKTIFNQIKNEKTKQLQQHLKSLQNWIERFNSNSLNDEAKRDAIFEISQMGEKEVFEKLLKILTEGTQYYLDGKDFQKKKTDFYRCMIEAIGRSGNLKAAPLILDSLEKLAKKWASIPLEKRDHSSLDFMVTLAQSLSYLKDSKNTAPLKRIRLLMGNESSFWMRTEKIFLQLKKK